MAEDTKFRAEKEEVVESKASALEMLKNSVSEEDSKPTAQLSLKMILGGDILNAQFVRRQLWLIVIVVVFVIVYVASR